MVLLPLENRFVFHAPEQVSGIIVLGGDEKPGLTQARGMPVAEDSLPRYVTFANLARRYPYAKIALPAARHFRIRRLQSKTRMWRAPSLAI